MALLVHTRAEIESQGVAFRLERFAGWKFIGELGDGADRLDAELVGVVLFAGAALGHIRPV